MAKRPKSHTCTKCARTFRDEAALGHHMHDAHNEGSPFVCPVCHAKFHTREHAARHAAKAHKVWDRPRPDLCRRPSLAEVVPICVECGKEGVLTDGSRIYPHRPDLHHKHFYLCECGAYCGCHPRSVVPLGRPCGPDTRRARMIAHDTFDPIWRDGHMSRSKAYQWLARETGIPFAECHIGMMTADQARLVTRIALAFRRSFETGDTQHAA